MTANNAFTKSKSGLRLATESEARAELLRVLVRVLVLALVLGLA